MRPIHSITALPVAVAALLLAGAAPAGAIPTSGSGWQIFGETGTAQTFSVPAGVVGVTVVVAGAGGGEGWDAFTPGPVAGAPGGGVVSDLATTPGSSLEVVVGGVGGNGTGGSGEATGGAAGFNGGGAGSANSDAGYGGGGGGGATEVGAASCAATLSCALVAGGGGGTGGGGLQASAGGAAGSPAGSAGTGADETTGGGGGTQSDPGAGGDGPDASPGSPGVLNVGGDGTSGGGGGGGGYFGGGGGAESSVGDGTGGGGGSSYGPAGAAFVPTDSSLDGGAATIWATASAQSITSSVDGGAAIIWATASALSITVGDSVTVTADVPFADGGGTETFTLGTTTLCSDVAVGESETASCQTTALPVGTDDVTATYTPPDPPDPYAGTTEVTAITVAAATVPVPTSGAGSPAGVPPLAPLLMVLGCAAILAGTRLHRAR